MAYDLCSPAIIDDVLAQIFDDCLSAVGFQKIRSRFYVRTRFREMNEVIEFHRSHLDLNFVWGLSLNFVPHITNGVENIRWHRTAKSALQDISHSGFGRKPQPGWSIQTTRGEENLRDSAELTRREMLPKALKYFDSIRGFQDCRPNSKRLLVRTIGVGHLKCGHSCTSPMPSTWRSPAVKTKPSR